MIPATLSAALCALLLLGLPGLSHATERAAAWKPERPLGSEQLRTASIQALILPEQANDKLLAAAKDLQSVFADQVGGQLELVSGGSVTAKHAIVLELRQDAPREGGFQLQLERTRLHLRSATQDGLSHGIYTLCRDLLQARWYWAGELGLEYIGTPPEKVPEYAESVRPDFIQRTLYPSNSEFARRNRLVGGFQFNHSLAKVFDQELYQSDPELFSTVNGKKRRPKGNGGLDPQPNLAHPKAVDIAAAAALEHFTQKPESRSFSLSINDNVLFDQSEATQQLVEPLSYFRRRPNYTDLVFGFMNAVAERVFEQGGAWQTAAGEDRYLTALAYYWTEQSPSFLIHPRVMPVLTSDRAQWHDPAYRAQDKALIQRWAQSGAERIASWDYYFGAPYPYPRQFNQWIAESLKHLHANGIDVFFSQLPAAWGLDGPKAWLASELLWDTEQDDQQLLDEYYRNFFGAAAEPIRAFYEAAEAHRNAHAGSAEWIKFYKDTGGIALFPLEELQAMRAHIEQAQGAVAADPRRLARVAVVSEAFALTENYARYNQAREALIHATLAGAAELPQLYSEFIATREVYQAHQKPLIEQPIHHRLKEFTALIQPDPSGMALLAMARNKQTLPPSPYKDLQALADGERLLPSDLNNGALVNSGSQSLSFLGPEIPKINGWKYSFRPSQWLRVSSAEGSEAGIRFTGGDIFVIYQTCQILPQQTYLLETLMDWQVSPDNRTYIKLSWRDRNKTKLRTDIPLQLPWGHSAGTQKLQIPLQSPAEAHDVQIQIISSRQAVDDFLQIKEIHLGRL